MSTTEAAPRGKGRPRGRKYTEPLVVYVTPVEAKTVQTLAKKKGTTVSSLARMLLLAESRREQMREEFEASLDQLSPEALAQYRQQEDEDPLELLRPELRGLD